MPLLAIDIGNTRLKWACYEAAEPGARTLAQGAEFLDHIERLAEGGWGRRTGLRAHDRLRRRR